MDWVEDRLFKFAFCMRRNRRNPESNRDFKDFLRELALIASQENWGDDFSILESYIFHTYIKLAHDYNGASDRDTKNKIIATSGDFACFNTGLFTDLYEPIYALFEKNKIKNKQPWFLVGFRKESDTSLNKFALLPERAQFFNNVEELVYDYRLDIRSNVSHILGDPENIDRLPEEYRNKSKPQLAQIFEGAVQAAKKKVSSNYKLAVPQYYKNSIQLLIPISLNGESPDLALAIKKENNVYNARTCLTLDMAYNNARLIVKPEVDWLVAPVNIQEINLMGV